MAAPDQREQQRLTAAVLPEGKGIDRWMLASLNVGQILNRIRICELLANVDIERFPETT